MFQSMLDNIQQEVIRILSRIEPMTQEQIEEMERRQREALEKQKMQMQHEQAQSLGQGPDGDEENSAAPKEPQHTPFVREGAKVGRNDPCPCGSGKKYKQCHGKLN